MTIVHTAEPTKDELLETYKHLAPITNGISDHASAAANIRRELKKQWSKTKFSVTSKSFAMGNSVTVSWTDGPTTRDVERAVTAKYQEGDFDGMTDCYENRKRGRLFRDLFGGAKYVHETRSISEEFAQAWHVKHRPNETYPIKDTEEWIELRRRIWRDEHSS